ncbi:MAG: SDR family oxidoreductase [Polaromonas sp.]|uniref:SDR family oxidoreductase n=1 Tax=Polaromonas sp. TaxID=1869339 RepID=UPI0025E86D40|nr:SDR family oxidoreductase [Polaromonas sp.]MBI2725365.1 SDR family oxidoreductase [Polaromonas sp.]
MNTSRPAILITGAGRGIGAATALLAASRGHPVSLLYRDRSGDAQNVVNTIEAAGGRALALQADVGIEADICNAFDKSMAHWGSLGGLVNNAGMNGGLSAVSGVSAEQLARLFAVNVSGAFLCVREACKYMTAGGAIVNVSSRAACLGAPHTWVHYAATKGALDTMTIGLAKELAPRGIRVNGVRPGFIDTEIHAQRPEHTLDALVKTVPLGRMGTPAEVAQAIAWLLSNEASYVTGATLDVAGGA